MTIKQILMPKEKDLGGFSVRRLLPVSQQRMVGPWILFDHMGPAQFPAGEGIDVRPHPHINLATVTYLYEGEILHRDSLGSEQTIRPGDVNLMVAGKGITHSEREREEVRQQDHSLQGLQLWHALPESHEEMEPAFYHYPAADLPAISVGETLVRLLMGSAYGQTSPVKTFAETVYIEAYMHTNDTLKLPETEQLAIYVAEGHLTLGQALTPQYGMVVLEDHASGEIQAPEDTRLVIIGGEKMSDRFVEWNFVSSSKDRITQAVADWRGGKFPKVIGDEEEFIPY